MSKPELKKYKFNVTSKNYDMGGALDIFATDDAQAQKTAEEAVKQANRLHKDLCLRIVNWELVG